MDKAFSNPNFDKDIIRTQAQITHYMNENTNLKNELNSVQILNETLQ